MKPEHIALLELGAARWNAWRMEHHDAPELSDAPIRGRDLSGFDLSGADLRRADLRGATLRGANLSAANLDGSNLFKAILDNADLAAASLRGVQFLNCAQLATTRNWQSAFRDDDLACGATIPPRA